jgi:hypothetical protein
MCCYGTNFVAQCLCSLGIWSKCGYLKQIYDLNDSIDRAETPITCILTLFMDRSKRQ